MSLKEVKSKIRSVKKIHQVTKAMEAVSAVKMRRSQAMAIEARPYAVQAIGILRRLIHRNVAKNHPLVMQREDQRKILFVVVTSDRGLAGALNSYVLKNVHRVMKEKGWRREDVSILAIGKKGYEHFAHRGYAIVDHLERWGEGVALGDPDKLGRRLIQKYQDKEFDRIMLAHSNFISTFSQEPVVRRLLPISYGALEDVIEGILPKHGKHSELREAALADSGQDYVYEPNAHEVLDELLPFLIGVVLHHAVLEGNASEHSARMVAMKSASDRARDLSKELTLKYNKERQTSITAEVSEITSGIEAMK